MCSPLTDLPPQTNKQTICMRGTFSNRPIPLQKLAPNVLAKVCHGNMKSVGWHTLPNQDVEDEENEDKRQVKIEELKSGDRPTPSTADNSITPWRTQQ